MKLRDIAPQELDEGMKEIVASALIGAAAMVPSKMVDPIPPKPSKADAVVWKKHLAQKEAGIITTALQAKYHRNPDELAKIFAMAKKYEKSTFPKAADILAIIGVESSFKEKSASHLEHDPAVGLMQVRPKIWGKKKSDFNSIENQIKFGSEILHKYYEKLGDPDDAVHAYNVGITNFKKSKGLNPSYVQKFHAERAWLEKQWKKVTT